MANLTHLFKGNPLSGKYFRVFTGWETPLTNPAEGSDIHARFVSGETRYPNKTLLSEVNG